MDLDKSLEQQRAELNAQYLQTVLVISQRQAVRNKDEFMLIQCKRDTFKVSVKQLHFHTKLYTF